MVKQIFCVFLVAGFVVQVLSKQPSPQEILETLKSSLEINNLVTRARRLSYNVTSVNREIEKTYFENDYRIRYFVASTVNNAFNPFQTNINEVSSSEHISNNSEAKSCVTSAQGSVARNIKSVSNSALNCSIEVSIKTFNFGTKVASLENMLSSSIFEAESNCTSSSLVDGLLDLNSTQNCYIKAAADLRKITDYISTEVKDLYSVLKVLQQNGINCITNGSQLAVQLGQGVVSTMINCGRNAGVLLFPANVVEAVNLGTSQIDEFSSNVSTILESGISGMIYLSDDSRNKSINSEIESSLKPTNELINYVGDILRDSSSPEELECLKTVKAQYETLFQSAVSSTVVCANKSYEYIDPTTVVQSRDRLQTILKNASAEAKSRCTNSSTVTKDSVRSCMAETLVQLKTEALAIVEHPRFISIRNQLSTAQTCIVSGRIDAFKSGDIILDLFAKCLAKQGIVLKYT